MPIKLNGATNGSVELDVPAAVGSDLQLTLPATAGDVVVKAADGSVDLGSVDIDSSGRLLVGTSSSSVANAAIFQGNSAGTDPGVVTIASESSSPASSALISALDFADNGHLRAARIECIRDGGTWTTGSSQPSGVVFSTTANGASSPTERMRITSAGNVGIGTNNPGGNLTITDASTYTLDVKSNGGVGALLTTLGGSASLALGTNNTERMRIDSNGQVQIGRTAPVGNEIFALQATGVPCGYIFQTSNTNVDVLELRNTYNQSGQAATYIRFADFGGTTRGSITATTSATAYNTSSDYRLKENIAPVTDGIARLNQLKPSRFNFIVDPDTFVDGFLAHEVQDIVPEAITGTKDAVDDDGNPIYQGIDQSKLVPLLTAALQEAIGRIETLEGMVAVNNITIDEQQHQISALETRLTALEGGTAP